ncbi:MAG: hypothetical protein J5544_02855 [Clostridia bacterium]|nr:hypothetical protein [Clostridia bacterium]
MKMRILSAVTSLLLLFALVPCIRSETVQDWTVPEGYNVNDYNKAAAFLEQADENGVKNGEKLSESYDPNDPETWGEYEDWDDELEDTALFPRFWWEETDGEKRLLSINAQSCDLIGAASFSGCSHLAVLYLEYNRITSVDVSECAELQALSLDWNEPLSDIDARGCSLLYYIGFNFCPLVTSVENLPGDSVGFLACCGSGLQELDLSDYHNLSGLSTTDSAQLTRIDVSGCEFLTVITCDNCNLSELILPDCKENLLSLRCMNNHLSHLELGYTNMFDLSCPFNDLDSLDLTGMNSLQSLVCRYNRISELDLTGLDQLTYLICSYNQLTSLDLSGCPNLVQLHSNNNLLTELDLSGNPLLPVDRVYALNSGTVGLLFESYQDEYDSFTHAFVYAEGTANSDFLGWYNEAGDLISTDAEFDFSCIIGAETVLIARFSGSEAIPGDIDMSGAIEVADAIMALRCTMGILELTPEQIEAGDMNESGAIEVSDAIIILRTAMGLLG